MRDFKAERRAIETLTDRFCPSYCTPFELARWIHRRRFYSSSNLSLVDTALGNGKRTFYSVYSVIRRYNDRLKTSQAVAA